MTQIDRYILSLFLRTVAVCFASLAGIFVVFHAFQNLNDLLDLAEKRETGLLSVMASYYGPYLLRLFDMTGAMMALMALLFVAAWLRHTGELTATLAAGVSHGRIFRGVILAALVIVVLQSASRELLLPKMRENLVLTSDLTGDAPQPILPSYDNVKGILLEGESIRPRSKLVLKPSFRLDGDYGEFGEILSAESAQWFPGGAGSPEGYLLQNVRLPENIDDLVSTGTPDQLVLMTRKDQAWIQAGCCFVATTVTPEILQTNQTATRLSSSLELIRRLRNPAVHNSMMTRVLLHERFTRIPLDFSLILLGLPMLVNRNNRNLFMMVGAAVGTILFFFALKAFASWVGGGGYLAPSIAVWIPLLILGPFGYMRFREVETV